MAIKASKAFIIISYNAVTVINRQVLRDLLMKEKSENLLDRNPKNYALLSDIERMADKITVRKYKRSTVPKTNY